MIPTLHPQAPTEGATYRPARGFAAPISNTDVNSSHEATGYTTEEASGTRNGQWLDMARRAFQSSETWLQVNQRAIWAQSMAHARSEHARGSPILNADQAHRARYFWPKSKALVRDIKSAAAAAYFTSSDVVAIDAENSDDPMQVEGATLMRELVNYRLNTSVPWYQLVLGAIHETAILGSVVSRQSWSYREDKRFVEQRVDPITQELMDIYEVTTVEDTPKVTIIPLENIRISPTADWVDPANSSPYIIEMIPLPVGDIRAKIENQVLVHGTPTSGEPLWYDIPTGTLAGSGTIEAFDTARQARTGAGKVDPKVQPMDTVDEFQIAWVHRNIVRRDGCDWLFYTVGTTIMLSDPVRLSDVIPWANGKRDYVMGRIEVETDRVYATSPVEMISGLQRATNELKNQRYDNVRQVLNRRYLYRQNGQVDMAALRKNEPGGLIGVAGAGDLSTHVSPLPVQDVTASAYQEEDRMNLSIDDIAGSQSGSTVNSNRNVQETATGMNLMAEAANKVREMELRTFTETWIEPVCAR